MEFEAMFLDNLAMAKLELLKTLLRTPQADTIADLAQAMGQTYQRTYNLFQALVDDLTVQYSLSPEQARTKLLADAAKRPSLDHYRFFLLQASLAWQYFDMLVQGHTPNLDQFCAKHFISRSTLTRKTNLLRKLLRRYRIRLNNAKAVIEGDEALVRRAIAEIYWRATRGVRWPFGAVDRATIAAQCQVRPNPAGLLNEFGYYQLAVARLRLAAGHTLAPLALPGAYDYFTADAFPHVTAVDLATENAGMTFLHHTNLNFSRSDQSAIQADLEAWFPQAARANVRLCQMLAANYTIDSPTACNLLRVIACFMRYGGDYLKACDFNQPPHQRFVTPHLHRELLAVISTLGVPALNTAAEAFAKMVTYLVAPLQRLATSPAAVEICVLVEPNDTMNQRLTTFLTNLQFVHLHNAQTLNQCDLVIAEADSLITPQTQAFAKTHPKQYFIWSLDAIEADYRKLFAAIDRLHQHKLIKLEQA
ncbi:helix-turn-helix domain-containing protein [Lacticaseibacillus jixiensis]|uniref:helix-turn-helix domain-containing protein n=1 Tax=Lacticaseibacillus jixiensis TaxID=3231926 RepID=UPI0036F2C6B6